MQQIKERSKEHTLFAGLIFTNLSVYIRTNLNSVSKHLFGYTVPVTIYCIFASLSLFTQQTTNSLLELTELLQSPAGHRSARIVLTKVKHLHALTDCCRCGSAVLLSFDLQIQGQIVASLLKFRQTVCFLCIPLISAATWSVRLNLKLLGELIISWINNI